MYYSISILSQDGKAYRYIKVNGELGKTQGIRNTNGTMEQYQQDYTKLYNACKEQGILACTKQVLGDYGSGMNSIYTDIFVTI